MNTLTDNKVEVGIWYRKELVGGISSNGKPYSITFKKGHVNKLLVFFVGGGLSWSEETAAKPITMGALVRKKEAFYISHILPIQLKFMHVGILNAKDKRNPFADWHILTIPYATADFHLGNNEYPYQDAKGNDKVIHHNGATNVEKALAVLKEVVPETPETLLIAGVSAGGFGCIAHSPNIHKLYPDCKNITVFADSSYLYSPKWTKITKEIWKINPDLEPYVKGDDLITDLFHYANGHLPDNTLFLHAVSVWDIDLVKFMNKMNNGKLSISSQALEEFHNSLISTVRKLKSEVPNYHYYLTDYGKSKKNGTTPHVFLGNPKLFYSEMQDSMSISNWLIEATQGKTLDVGTNFIENDTLLFK